MAVVSGIWCCFLPFVHLVYHVYSGAQKKCSSAYFAVLINHNLYRSCTHCVAALQVPNGFYTQYWVPYCAPNFFAALYCLVGANFDHVQTLWLARQNMCRDNIFKHHCSIGCRIRKICHFYFQMTSLPLSQGLHISYNVVCKCMTSIHSHTTLGLIW